MKNQIEILDPPGEGYKTVLMQEGWRIGLITAADRFRVIRCVERHMLTDEAFILLVGEAILLHMDCDDNLCRYDMEHGRVYRVPRAEWHNVIIADGAVLMVVENPDTGPDNTEYRDLNLPVTAMS